VNLPSCNDTHHLTDLSIAFLLRANMHIIPLSSVQHLSFLLRCRSPRCHQYCTTYPLVPSFTSNYHILTRESSFVLPCTLYRCQQYSIFPSCYHAHHLTALNNGMSSSCYDAHYLADLSTASLLTLPACHLTVPSTDSYLSATMHITLLPSAYHPSSCHHVHYAVTSRQRHLPFVQPCTSPRCPQYSNYQSCYQAHHLAVLCTVVFLLMPSCTSRYQILTGEASFALPYASIVLPCTPSHCPQNSKSPSC